jgi:hypothetical protein
MPRLDACGRFEPATIVPETARWNMQPAMAPKPAREIG